MKGLAIVIFITLATTTFALLAAENPGCMYCITFVKYGYDHLPYNASVLQIEMFLNKSAGVCFPACVSIIECCGPALAMQMHKHNTPEKCCTAAGIPCRIAF